MGGFEPLDLAIFLGYLFLIIGIGIWVSRGKKGQEKTAEDYFLASKALPWWAIGTSLIAANISAEQMVGMSGQGFGLGLAIASYEWMAAITLLIVAKFFLPIFLEKKLYTIPQFVEQRYSVELKTILAIFWIALFTFVNLTTVLLLGAMAIDTIIGGEPGEFFYWAIFGLAFVAAAYSLWGGLAAVAWTDVLQVSLLVIGGAITTYLALVNLTPEGGLIAGLKLVFEEVGQRIPEFNGEFGKFNMILSKDHPSYSELPGIGVLIGGLWVANLYYWGFNQYIIQRALAAKNLREAQNGLALAGFLKLLIPLIVVIPGIVAFVYYMQNEGTNIVEGVGTALYVENPPYQANDNAFPWLIRTFVPTGLKGLVVAALAAAIVSSLASMMNSVSTIFTMDIYRQYINPNANNRQTVSVGRGVAALALVIAIALAPLMQSSRGIFNVIQEYTGLVSPGILAVFMLGLFYKKATNRGAVVGVILSIVIALLFKFIPVWTQTDPLPFLDQMGYTFLITCFIIAGVSYLDGKGENDSKGIFLSWPTFKTGPAFNISAFAIVLITAFLYTVFW